MKMLIVMNEESSDKYIKIEIRVVGKSTALKYAL